MKFALLVALAAAALFMVVQGLAARPIPRLPHAFMANNVTVTYADGNLEFVNATYYYDYYNRAERIDLLSVNSTNLPYQTIINLYGRPAAGSADVKVVTYVIDYQTLKAASGKVYSFYNCTRRTDMWQFGYGMNDMPFWVVNDDPDAGVHFVSFKLDGNLKYELWQDDSNGERFIYKINTENRNIEFASLLYAQDHMYALQIKGIQSPFTVNPKNFDVKSFGC